MRRVLGQRYDPLLRLDDLRFKLGVHAVECALVGNFPDQPLEKSRPLVSQAQIGRFQNLEMALPGQFGAARHQPRLDAGAFGAEILQTRILVTARTQKPRDLGIVLGHLIEAGLEQRIGPQNHGQVVGVRGRAQYVGQFRDARPRLSQPDIDIAQLLPQMFDRGYDAVILIERNQAALDLVGDQPLARLVECAAIAADDIVGGRVARHQLVGAQCVERSFETAAQRLGAFARFFRSAAIRERRLLTRLHFPIPASHVLRRSAMIVEI